MEGYWIPPDITPGDFTQNLIEHYAELVPQARARGIDLRGEPLCPGAHPDIYRGEIERLDGLIRVHDRRLLTERKVNGIHAGLFSPVSTEELP